MLNKNNKLFIQKTFKEKNNNFLYILGTPIGNLSEINLRIIKILKEEKNFIVESIKQFRKLMAHLDISLSNKNIKVANLKNENNIKIDLKKNENWVLASDAGYPLICDPGYKIIKEFEKNNFYKIVISGSSPILCSLLYSKGPYYPFYFHGFLSKKRKKMLEELTEIINIKKTSIFYVSKYNVIKTLELINYLNKNLLLTVCKELSKINEAIFYGNSKNLIEYFQKNNSNPKGEYVFVINYLKI